MCMCFCVCRSVEYLQNACCEGAANKDFDSDSDSVPTDPHNYAYIIDHKLNTVNPS